LRRPLVHALHPWLSQAQINPKEAVLATEGFPLLAFVAHGRQFAR